MNKRIVLSSCAAVILSLTIASAQTANQTPTQSPVQGSTQGIDGQTRVGTGVETGTQVTVTGCVVRESEHTNARGGVLGTGVGAGNEFVLANATTGRTGATANAQIASGVSGSTSTGSGAPAVGTSGAATGTSETPVGTSGTASGTSGAASETSGTASGTGTSSGTSATTTTTTTTPRTMIGGIAYSLTGNRENELALHVGKRVEVVGTVDPSSRGAGASANVGGGAAGASGQAGASANTQGASNMQELTIVSFRPVEGACP